MYLCTRCIHSSPQCSFLWNASFCCLICTLFQNFVNKFGLFFPLYYFFVLRYRWILFIGSLYMQVSWAQVQLQYKEMYMPFMLYLNLRGWVLVERSVWCWSLSLENWFLNCQAHRLFQNSSIARSEDRLFNKKQKIC